MSTKFAIRITYTGDMAMLTGEPLVKFYKEPPVNHMLASFSTHGLIYRQFSILYQHPNLYDNKVGALYDRVLIQRILNELGQHTQPRMEFFCRVVKWESEEYNNTMMLNERLMAFESREHRRTEHLFRKVNNRHLRTDFT